MVARLLVAGLHTVATCYPAAYRALGWAEAWLRAHAPQEGATGV